jgi:DNA-binding MarR family transcriptional regulator
MNLYLQTALCFEQWHCTFLSYIKIFLYQQSLLSLTPNQIMLIYHMSTDRMRMSEITYSTFFWGTNPYHNLNKLIQLGYLSRHKHPHDKRLSLIVVEEKGKQLRAQFHAFLDGDFFKKEGQKNRIFSQDFLESLCALFNSP